MDVGLLLVFYIWTASESVAWPSCRHVDTPLTRCKTVVGAATLARGRSPLAPDIYRRRGR